MRKDTLVSQLPLKHSFIMILVGERRCFEGWLLLLWRSWIAGCFTHHLALGILVYECKAMSVLWTKTGQWNILLSCTWQALPGWCPICTALGHRPALGSTWCASEASSYIFGFIVFFIWNNTGGYSSVKAVFWLIRTIFKFYEIENT